jgi:hypothetical protein
MPGIETLQLPAYLSVAWCQFKSALQLPQGLWKRTLFVIDDAQTYPGDKILRISAQRPLEELDRLSIQLPFKASLSQQTVGLYMFGILTQDVLAVGDCLVQVNIPNHILDFRGVVLQSDVWHLLSSPQLTTNLPN